VALFSNIRELPMPISPDRIHRFTWYEGDVIVTYNPKPIPDRRADYEATPANYDLGSPIGHGATPDEAIADLKQEVER